MKKHTRRATAAKHHKSHSAKRTLMTAKPKAVQPEFKENEFPTETVSSEEQPAGESGGPISSEAMQEQK